MSIFGRYLFAALATVVLAGCTTFGAGSGGTPPSHSQADLASRTASVLQRQMTFPASDRIPQELVANARCIAVFPSVIQAGFIVGGRRGQGLVSCRQQSGGWGHAAPAVYTLTGASVGLQAGVEKSSVVLLFMTRDSATTLLEKQIKLGAEVGVVAGPVGFNLDVTGAPAPVLSYVSSKFGLFAGVNLNGTQLSFSENANGAIYGLGVGPREVLFTPTSVPPTLDTFVQTLQEFAPYPGQ